MGEITGPQSVVFDGISLGTVENNPPVKVVHSSPIGMYDSGLGGLTVLSEVAKQLPTEDVVYFGDTAHVPYGGRTPNEILRFNYEIMDFLVSIGVKIAIMACGTSSALAYPIIKDHYKIPIIPLIDNGANAAAGATENKKIGVIATQATVDSSAYKRAIRKIRSDLEVFEVACPMFVPLIEGGFIDSKETIKTAKEYLKPLKREGIDTLILGCTHYPHLLTVLRDIMGINVKFIDPAVESVAMAKRILSSRNHIYTRTQPFKPSYRFFVSGSVAHFKDMGSRLMGQPLRNIRQVTLPKQKANQLV